MFRRHRKRQQVLKAYRQRRGENLDELTPRARSRTRQRRRRRPRPASPWPALLASPSRLVALVGATSLAMSLLLMSLSPRFYVGAAEIYGNERLSDDLIAQHADIAGRHIFAVDNLAVAKKLQEHSEIELAEVRTGMDGHSAIGIKEVPIALIWQHEKFLLGLDEVGRPIQVDKVIPDLPLVIDEVGLLAGPTIGIDPEIAYSAASLAKDFDIIRYRADVGFVVRNKQGTEIRFGRTIEDASAKVAALDAIEGHLGDSLSRVELIDLRFHRRPYYRFKGD